MEARRLEVDDLVDVIISKEYYKKNLIFTNTKNQKNGQIYANIAKELQERVAARGQSFLFVAKQLRTKFKNLISICKNAALTVKTGTGIKRFQDDKGYGNWLRPFFQLLEPEIHASLIRPLSHLQILPELQQVHRVVAARRRARRTLMNIFLSQLKEPRRLQRAKTILKDRLHKQLS